MSTNGAQLNGSLRLAMRQPAQAPSSGELSEELLSTYERTAAALAGVVALVDVQENWEDQAKQLRAHSKLLLAVVRFTLEMARFNTLKVTPGQLERLGALEDDVEELVDTLDVSLDHHADVATFATEELSA